MRRLLLSVTATLVLCALAAPVALAQSSGQGAIGEAGDKKVTNAGFILIAFFPLFILLMSLLQNHLEKRKDARKAAVKARGAARCGRAAGRPTARHLLQHRRPAPHRASLVPLGSRSWPPPRPTKSVTSVAAPPPC